MKHSCTSLFRACSLLKWRVGSLLPSCWQALIIAQHLGVKDCCEDEGQGNPILVNSNLEQVLFLIQLQALGRGGILRVWAKQVHLRIFTCITCLAFEPGSCWKFELTKVKANNSTLRLETSKACHEFHVGTLILLAPPSFDKQQLHDSWGP